MTTKLPAADRRDQIIKAAVLLAAKHGLPNVTRDQIAAAAGLSTGSINKYFSTMPQLRRDVMRHAVITAGGTPCPERHAGAALAVVAQGLALKDKHALKAPDAVKKAALETLAAA